MTHETYSIYTNVAERPEKFITGYRKGDELFMSAFGVLTKAPENRNLEVLFQLYNADDRSNGQIAHSLSVGDVVMLDGKAFAVAMVGFSPIESFKPITAMCMNCKKNPIEHENGFCSGECEKHFQEM